MFVSLMVNKEYGFIPKIPLIQFTRCFAMNQFFFFFLVSENGAFLSASQLDSLKVLSKVSKSLAFMVFSGKA